MALHILIIPDKFKGTLTARAAAKAIALGWREARPEDSLDLLPMSDGGDGFGDVTSALLQAKSQRVRTVDAAHRPCLARWWWEPRTKTAIIESAAVIGLAMLPRKRFHPFQLDTQGLCAVMRAALKAGATRCLMGLGGSATNDGGFGLAQALGWQFLDGDGRLIEHWQDLHLLQSIRAPQQRRWFARCLAATDVQNPLLGPQGATRVYGPQKGLRPRDFALAERCLKRLAQVVKQQFGRDFAREPGAGAAGGLGFGLLAFLRARLQPGFDLFAQQEALERRLRAADLVITGEGMIDRSTLMGKGVGRIAERCQRLNIPCIGLAGMVSANRNTAESFNQIHALTELTTLAQAKARPAYWLGRLARRAANSTPSLCTQSAAPKPKSRSRKPSEYDLRIAR